MLSTSNEINELAVALSNAQSEFQPIVKTKTAKIPTKNGGSYSYTYADLGIIWEAILPALKANGLSVVQTPTTLNEAPALTTLLLHSSGQYIQDTMLLHIEKTDAQGQGSAITYARRYALSALLGLVTEDDDDGGVATENRRSSQPATPQGSSNSLGDAVAKAAGKPASAPAKTGMVTESMTKMIWAITHKGMDPAWNDGDMFDFIDNTVGRRIEKLTELTFAEAQTVINSLKELQGN